MKLKLIHWPSCPGGADCNCAEGPSVMFERVVSVEEFRKLYPNEAQIAALYANDRRRHEDECR